MTTRGQTAGHPSDRAHAEQIRARVFKPYSSGERLRQSTVDLITCLFLALFLAICIGIALLPFAMLAVCFYG